MNLVERFFADLTAYVIRSGSFASIGELVRDIEAYLSFRSQRRPKALHLESRRRRNPRKNQPRPRRPR
jgi:hypothetical protein